jgi:hypothetical protein
MRARLATEAVTGSNKYWLFAGSKLQHGIPVAIRDWDFHSFVEVSAMASQPRKLSPSRSRLRN